MTEQSSVAVRDVGGLTFVKPGAVAPRIDRNSDVGVASGMTKDDLRPGDKGQLYRLKLLHKPHADGGQPGWWFETATGTFMENPEVFFLAEVGKGQILWPEVFDPDNKPLCLSHDGLFPADPTPQRPMDERREGPCYIAGQESPCPDARWTRVEDGDDIPPRCAYQRKFYVLVLLDTGPEVLQAEFHGTALKPVKALTDKLKRVGFRQSFILSSKYAEDGKDYWIPRFADGEKLDGDGLVFIQAIHDEYWAGYQSGELRSDTDTTPVEYDYPDAVEGEVKPEVEEDAIPF